MGKLHAATSLGLTAAGIVAQFAPVPYMTPAVDLLVGIVNICAKVKCNQRAVHQIRDRCHSLLLVIKDQIKPDESMRAGEALEKIQLTLINIRTQMDTWAELNWVEALAKQDEIAKDIQKCNTAISDCLTQFQITTQVDILDWQSECEENRRRDHAEIIHYLADIQNSQAILTDAFDKRDELLFSVMTRMQQALGDSPGDWNNNGLQSNLYQLQLNSGTLLPDFNLNRGEVRRIGSYPISNSSTGLDIWEGLYLNREKVAIKVIRAVSCSPSNLRRFNREVDIWIKIWKLDKGKHILPFYGFCQNDGPYPYMVSPWQANGNAIGYVIKYPDVDHIQLIRGIGEGIKVLHTMDPPVIHGDIRGANIMINTLGDPLLADFGVARIVEDMAGVPFSKSYGIGEYCRWFAPELYIGEGTLSTQADIYAYGMTILELMTHQRPFSRYKHTGEVVVRCAEGKRPPRPTDPQVAARGLDDKLWDIIQQCWKREPSERPSIQEILAHISESS